MSNNNITSDSFWIKTLYLILFFVIYRVLDVAVFLLLVIQWGFNLFTGESNPALTQFSSSLSVYIQQIVAFIGGASEEKPYPFSDWPHND